MRNFTFIAGLLLISAMAFGQPVVKPVWDHSVAGTADWSTGIPIGGEVPKWMGNISERGMAFHDSALYIVSRKVTPNVILVLDAATGDSINTIEIDTVVVKGGTYLVNDIAITPSGKILVANLATNTIAHPFKVYMIEKEGEGNYKFTTLLEWQQDTAGVDVEKLPYRIGDGFAFYGDVSAEEDGYIIVGNANAAATEPVVLKWNVQAGVIDTVPQIITLKEVYPAPLVGTAPKLGITPRIFPLDSMHFWADGHSTYPALYDMQGELLSTFSGATHPLQTGISGVVFFSFKNQQFILTPATNHVPPANTPAAMFQLFQIPEAGAEEADSIAVFPERGLGGNSNGSYAAPMAVDVQEDRVMMYIMSPNNGLAAFELTMGGEPGDVTQWNISNDQFNALGSMVATTEVDGLTIFAGAGKNVDVDANSKTLEEWEFTHRLKLGGAGGFDEAGQPLDRVVAFGVTGNSKITIALQSSSSSADRILNVAVGHKDSIIAEVSALGASISKGEVEYFGDSATIFLYSPSSGVNIYLIKVEPLTTSFKPIDNKTAVRIYPNPATDKVFVNVKKPTQVAVFNLSGQMVKSRLVESASDYIDVSDLNSGLYIIKSQLNNEFTQKLIVR